MYKIYEKLAKAKGVSNHFVAKETGVSAATMSSWKRGVYHPRDEKLQKIADYFDVPLAYLKGEQSTVTCPSCFMAYDPLDIDSSKKHDEYHKHFLTVEKRYGATIPSREEVEKKRVDALIVLHDISYDKYRRTAAFSEFAKYDHLLQLYESDFQYEKNLIEHTKYLAEILRPDRGISLDLCNHIRAQFGVDEYIDETHVTEREYEIIRKYRSLAPEAAALVDKMFGIE